MEQKGVLWAAVSSIMAAFLANIIAPILVVLVFWPQSFVKNECDGLGILGGWFFLVFAFVLNNGLFAAGGLITFVKPSFRTVVIRFLVAAAICVLTIAYCLAVVYFWIVLPGIKAPWILVFNMWILSLFPMLLLSHIALSGVYYVGDKRRDAHLRNIQLIKDAKSKAESIGDLSMDADVDDEKPLISEA